MRKCICPPTALAATVLALVFVSAGAEPPSLPYLAILNRSNDPGVEGLLFRSLSHTNTLRLVERKFLDAILKEHELSMASLDSCIRLGRLVRADLLLIVESDSLTYHVSLVETAHALRLYETRDRRDRQTLEIFCDAVAAQVARVLPTLGLPPRQRCHLALLPLEQDPNNILPPVYTGRTADKPGFFVADVLAPLLASRIVDKPSFLLVERKDLADLVIESQLSDSQWSELSAADYAVQGKILATPGPGKTSVKLSLRKIGAKRVDAAIFVFDWVKDESIAEAAAKMADWIESKIQRNDTATDTAEDRPHEVPDTKGEARSREARRHYEYGLGAGGIQSLECAYRLAPDEPLYGQTLLQALCRRKDEVEFAAKAFDLGMKIDARKEGPIIPLSACLNGVPGQAEGTPTTLLLKKCRSSAKAYYLWFTDYANGMPDIERRKAIAKDCPVLFDEPGDAIAFLKALVALGDFDWSGLANHRFLHVEYWNKEEARALWEQFLVEATKQEDTDIQFQAHRALCALKGAFFPDAPKAIADVHEYDQPDALSACHNLLEWASGGTKRIDKMIRFPEFWNMWPSIACLDERDISIYFNTVLSELLLKNDKTGAFKGMKRVRAEIRDLARLGKENARLTALATKSEAFINAHFPEGKASATITEYGRYDAAVRQIPHVEQTAETFSVTKPIIHETTTTIPCQVGETWGFTVKYDNLPADRAFKWRSATVHPPITQPDGTVVTNHVRETPLQPGQRPETHALWIFAKGYEYELVPGNWTKTLLIDDVPVASMTFKIVPVKGGE